MECLFLVICENILHATTLLNAFLIFMNMAAKISLLWDLSTTHFNSYKVVKCLDLKVNCSLHIFLPMAIVKFSKIINSNALERNESNEIGRYLASIYDSFSCF